MMDTLKKPLKGKDLGAFGLVSAPAKVPQRIDGCIMLPAVSVAIEKPISPAAIAELEPEDDPAASWCGFQGLRVRVTRLAMATSKQQERSR
jgi:hypothetical protein